MRLVNIILTILFALFALFQWNDPDALSWILAYGYAAILTGLTLIGFRNKKLIYLGLIAYILGIINLFPEMLSWIQSGAPSLFGAMKAESAYIENVREFFGLFFCLLLMIYLLFPFKIHRR